MLKKIRPVTTLVLFLLLAYSNNTHSQEKHVFEYVNPEDAGFSSAKLDTLADFLQKADSYGMILMVDGKIMFEWGETERKHTIHSIRKTLMNALYGIKVEEGIIDTNMTIRELGIDDIYKLTENEKDARIADLLKSRSGIYHSAAAVSQGMLRGMPQRDTHKPGEHYYYNNWDFNVLGVILEQQTGRKIYELFLEEIAIPIGMHDYIGEYSSLNESEIEDDKEYVFPQTDGFYQYEPEKSKYPAYHFRLSARDMALFGQLFIKDGNWNGKQIISKEWIEQSTRPFSVYNPRYGIAYGMLWNVLMKTESRSSRSYYHTGTGIHMLGVYPASKLVLVHRVNTEDEHDFEQRKLLEMIGYVWDAQIE